MSAEVHEIEVTIEELKEIIADKEAVERLFNNRDFKKLMVNKYFESEAIRLVGALADPRFMDKPDPIYKEMNAISQCKDYFRTMITMGHNAERSLAEHEEALDELRELDMDAA